MTIPNVWENQTCSKPPSSNNSLTWNKAIWGWFPPYKNQWFPVEQWGRDEIYPESWTPWAIPSLITSSVGQAFTMGWKPALARRNTRSRAQKRERVTRCQREVANSLELRESLPTLSFKWMQMIWSTWYFNSEWLHEQNLWYWFCHVLLGWTACCNLQNMMPWRSRKGLCSAQEYAVDLFGLCGIIAWTSVGQSLSTGTKRRGRINDDQIDSNRPVAILFQLQVVLSLQVTLW